MEPETSQDSGVSSGTAQADCDPHVVRATPDEYELRNRRKALNFILGELVQGGQLSFIVENKPKDGKGCRGTWLFGQLIRHFGVRVTAIQGNWTYGDNLAVVNRLTAAGAALEEAARQGFTGKRAAEWGFTQVRIVPPLRGTAGSYTQVHVLFER